MSCLSKRKARARALEKRKPILPYSPRVERARPLQFHDSGVRVRRADVRQLRANGTASFASIARCARARSPQALPQRRQPRVRQSGISRRIRAGLPSALSLFLGEWVVSCAVSTNSRAISANLCYSIALCIQRYVRAMGVSIAESADVAALYDS